MNRATITGRLTRDPEIRYTQDQKAIAKFSVAVDVFGKEKKTYFVPITVFGNQAENCERFLKKGSMVGVDGSIVTDSYEKDGQRHYSFGITAQRIDFLSPKGEKVEEPKEEIPEGFAALDSDIPF